MFRLPGNFPTIFDPVLEAERRAREARDAAIRLGCNSASVQNDSLRNLARRAFTFASQMFGVTPRNEDRASAMQQMINYVLLVNSSFNACVQESLAEARARTTAAQYAREAAAIAAKVFNVTNARSPRLTLSFEVLLEMQSRMRALGLNCLNYLVMILEIPPGDAAEICRRSNNLANPPGGGISFLVRPGYRFSDALIRLGRDAPGVLIQQPATPTSVQRPSIGIVPPMR